jgi:hypothetical protein
VSVLLNLIGVSELSRDVGRNAWMWFFFGAVVFVAAAFVAYYRLYRDYAAASPAARRDLVLRFTKAQHDLTGFLRNRSEQAPGAEAEAQRTAIRSAGEDPGRHVHGDSEWQGKTIWLWRETLRTSHMLLAEEAENLGACTRAEREMFNPKDPRSVEELWDAQFIGYRIVQRLKGVEPLVGGHQ